jgi:hypothetical protein
LHADDDIQVEATTAERGKPLEKEWAYTRDHQRLALMIACVVCGPSEPQKAVFSILKGRTATKSSRRGGRMQHLTEQTQQLIAIFRTGLQQASKKLQFGLWLRLISSLKRIPVSVLPIQRLPFVALPTNCF